MNNLLGLLVILCILYLSNCFTQRENITLMKGDCEYKLYTLSKPDVRNTTQDDAYSPAYGSSLVMDGDMRTYCWALSFWSVRFLRSFTIEQISIYAFSSMSTLPTVTFINLETNETMTIHSCRFTNSSANNVSCQAGEPFIFDVINITAPGSRIMFNEVTPIVSTYIHVTSSVIEMLSTFNTTQNCFISTIIPKIEIDAWCCVNMTANLYLDGESIYEVSFNDGLPSYTMDRCHQTTEPLILNFTTFKSYVSYHTVISPPLMMITKDGLDAPLITIESIYETSGLLKISRTCSLDNMECIPYRYINVIISGGITRRIECLPEDRCEVPLEGLEPETLYTVEVTGGREITNVEYPTQTASTAFPTRACTEPDPVAIGNIRNILSQKQSIEIKVNFKAGETHCLLSNVTYMLSLVSKDEILMLECLASTFCGAVVQPYTKYNLTVTTINSAGKEANATQTWTSSEIAPSAPHNLTYTLVHDGSQYLAKIRWSPPERPNGLIRLYHLRYHTGGDWRSTVVMGNATSYNIQVQPRLTYRLELVAETIKPGARSSALFFKVPADELPGRPEYFTQDVDKKRSTKCVTFQWSSEHAERLPIRYNIICQPECSKPSKYNCTLEHTLNAQAHANSSRATACGFSDTIDYRCGLLVKNYYRECELSSVIVNATYSDDQVMSVTPMPNEITLILIGVAISVFIIATATIIGLYFKLCRRSEYGDRVPLTDDDAWLMSDQSHSTNL